MNIEGVEIGGASSCRFVAEISNNHNGDFARALRLIDAAKGARADFVKFQAYTADELVALRGDGHAPDPWGAQGWTMRTLYEKAATPLEWFPALFDHARTLRIVPFSSVFGEESLRVLRSVDCPAYKVASLDRNTRARTLAHMAGKPTLVSMPGAEPEPGHAGELNLWCPPGYPQPDVRQSYDRYNDVGDWYVKRFDGFSYHGTDPLPCVVAATLGAKIIEAHFQLDDEPSALEANISLTASQFSQMVRDVRRVEALLE